MRSIAAHLPLDGHRGLLRQEELGDGLGRHGGVSVK